MTPIDGGLSRTLLNKVPQVTIWFWIIKIMATTVGETGADLITVNLNMGLTVTSWLMGAVFLVALVLQLRTDRYTPPLYWITVVLISVVGTLVSDNLVDGMGFSLVNTSATFGYALVLVFIAWFASERTLSIHSVVTRRRELFYWAAILATFALGTSLGDLLAERLDLGYLQTAIVFAAAIAIVAGLYFVLGVDEVFCFWLAYILTRPMGASLGDFLAKPVIAGGLGLGTVNTSLVFLAVIALVVGYLTVSKTDRLDTLSAQP